MENKYFQKFITRKETLANTTQILKITTLQRLNYERYGHRDIKYLKTNVSSLRE